MQRLGGNKMGEQNDSSLLLLKKVFYVLKLIECSVLTEKEWMRR